MTSFESSGDGDDDGDKGGGKKRKKMSSADLADVTLSRRPKSTRTRRVPARIAQPDPALSAALAGGGTEGPCGGFTRIRNWQVTNGRRGLIIQRVTRTFAVERYDAPSTSWVAITGVGLNTYVTDPGSSVHGGDAEYWEAWQVRADGAVTNGTDRFALCGLVPSGTAASFGNTTRGSFTISGEARFYPTTASPADLNFTDNSVGAAGALPARTTDPAGDLGGRGIAAVGAAVQYTVISTWDSSWVGAPSTTAVPFIPPAAISVIT